MKYLKLLIDKLKDNKLNRKTLIILLVGLLSIFIIFVSEMDFNKKDDDAEIINYNTDDYCLMLEQKIESFIESIDGAGDAKVVITLSETTEYIYATDDKEIKKGNENGEDWTIENNHVIIKNSNENSGLLIKTIEPKIRGIAIACTGGDDIRVQEQIFSAVSALLNISTSEISISKLNVEE